MSSAFFKAATLFQDLINRQQPIAPGGLVVGSGAAASVAATMRGAGAPAPQPGGSAETGCAVAACSSKQGTVVTKAALLIVAVLAIFLALALGCGKGLFDAESHAATRDSRVLTGSFNTAAGATCAMLAENHTADGAHPVDPAPPPSSTRREQNVFFAEAHNISATGNIEHKTYPDSVISADGFACVNDSGIIKTSGTTSTGTRNFVRATKEIVRRVLRQGDG
eukprot:COSAG04_NODE_6076_length_1416_cov_45.870919_2_plen_222_part_01